MSSTDIAMLDVGACASSTVTTDARAIAGAHDVTAWQQSVPAGVLHGAFSE
jgi:hypothetical protein